MKKFFLQLAWLRGFAAFAVVFYHIRRGLNVSYTGNDPAVDNSFLKAIDLGDFGVLLFFVLSGTTLYLNHQSFNARRSLTTFFAKRFFRVWPAFFVSFIIFLLFIPVFKSFYLPELQGHWVEVHADSNYQISDIFKYLSFVFNITGPAGKFNIVYWSLPIEFQYYLIFPLLVLSLRWMPYFGPILIGGILYGLLHTEVRSLIANAWTLMLAYTFCGGVLIGYLYRKWYQVVKIPMAVSFALAGLILICTSLISNFYQSFPTVIQSLPIIGIEMNMFGILALALVLVTIFTDFESLQESRVSKLFVFLGEISYSVYLYHCLFIALGVLVVINLDISSYYLKFGLVTMFTLIGTTIFSYASYRYIERPSIKLGKRLVKTER